MNGRYTMRTIASARRFVRQVRALTPPLVACAIAFTVAGLCAPAAAAQATPPPQYLFGYVGGDSGGIFTYTVDPNSGALTLAVPTPLTPRSPVGTMAVNPAGTMLFSTTENSASEPAVGAFNIASDGSLTEVLSSPFSDFVAGAVPITCTVSRDGHYLYLLSSVLVVDSQGEGSHNAIVEIFSINSDGSLARVNSYTVVGMFPYAMFLHATGSWLYIWGTTGPENEFSTIEQFTVGVPPLLTDNGPFPLQLFSSPPQSLVGDNLGTFLYALYQQIGGGSEGLIDSLAVDPVNGSLSIASNFNNVTGNPSAMLAVASTSNYLFSTAYSYSIAGGVLTQLATFPLPFPEADNPPALLASPTTPFLFESAVSGQQVAYLSSQVIASDGTLSNAPGSPYVSTNGTTFTSLAITGIAPVPTAPVLRVNGSPIVITNIALGQTGPGGIGVTNWGYSPLIISNVSISGDPSLSQTNTCTAAPLAPMDSCLVNVSFVPTSVGTFTGTLTIESNTPTQTVPITATSQNAQSNPEIIAPSPVLFPDTAMGASNALTIQLENNANATAPLTVSGVTFIGSNPGDFSQTNNCSAPIAAGAFCSITITFTPQALGNRAALLDFATNAGAVEATVTGTAVTTVTKYSFTTVVNGPGTITQSPTGTSFANNTTITLTETPNANSSFVNWGGVCPQVFTGPCTFILNATTVATANFVANVTLTTSVIGPGIINQNPPGTSFAPGSDVVLNASPNPGATFVSWTSSSPCLPTTATTECIVQLNANTTVTATFSGAQVSLSTSAVGPGTIQQSPAGTSFNSGTSITLTAVPNASAAFNGWSGACAGSTNPVCTFTLNSNTSVVASFVNVYTLTTTVSGPGTITQSPTGVTFNSGTSITLTAVPAANATFTSWTGACSASTNPVCTFALSANTTVTATFTAPPAVTPSQPSQTGSAGSAFTFQINETGFTTKPTLTATCTIPAGSCTISGSTLTVATTARASSAVVTASVAAILPPPMHLGGPSTPPALTPSQSASVRLALTLVLGFLLLISARRARRILRVAALVGGLALLAACGGSGTGGTPPASGTPAGTYSVTVTATAGTQTATTVVSIIVQ